MTDELRETTDGNGLSWLMEKNAQDWWMVAVTDGTRSGLGMHANQDIAKARAVLQMREDEV